MDIHLFDAFPEPVLQIGLDGAILYSNSALLALEPGWTEGSPAPAELELQPDVAGVYTCTLGERPFLATCTLEDQGTLLVLRPIPPAPTNAFRPGLLAAHLRGHLQQLTLAAQLLSKNREGEAVRGESREHLAMVQQTLYRMVRLVNHLEDADDIDAERVRPLSLGALDLAALCRDLAYGVSALTYQFGIVFQESTPPGIVATVGDRAVLENMLLELISNALKAAGPGGRAGLRLASTGSHALITVWDNGSGVEPADLTALMARPSENHLLRPETGLGLGWALARHAATLHGGTILLESTPGMGLHATVSLPIRRPTKGMLNSPAKEPEGGYSPLLTGLADALPWQAFLEEV